MLKSKVILGCAALVGVICTSSFLSYAKNDDTAITETVTENSDNEAVTENPDYGEILAPYENIFDEFNNSHGTNYGFMTDEQLERAGKSREEYEKEMVEEYGSMTPEEFEAFLDEAYSKDQEFSAEMEAYGVHPAYDTATTETVTENTDYKEILTPYENIFDEFNNSHGTNYGFMTDEQLERAGKSCEEYEKEMVEEYGNMTPEEFKAFLDETYSKDQEFSAEMEAYGAHPADDAEITETVAENSDTEKKLSPQNLPYYQKEEPENKEISVMCNSYGIKLLKN